MARTIVSSASGLSISRITAAMKRTAGPPGLSLIRERPGLR